MAGVPGLNGPAKLPTRLYRDLSDHDSRYARANGYNILYDNPPRHGNLSDIRRQPGRDCQHVFVRKDDQSTVPQTIIEDSVLQSCMSAAFCSKCFTHFDISIGLDDVSHDFENPLDYTCCYEREDAPVHVFGQIETERRTVQVAQERDRFDPWVERHMWSCYDLRCPAILTIKISPPRLDEKKRHLLFSRAALRHRGEKEIGNEPDRFKEDVPMSPGEALSILRQYLVNANEDASVGKPPRRVATRNKKFLLSFSDECNDVLQWLGFDPIRERDVATNQLNDYWTPPNLIGLSLNTTSELGAEGKQKKNLKHLTNDVVCEINQLLMDLPPHDRGLKHPTISSLPASRDIQLVLGISPKQKLQTIDLDNDERPYYAGLGTTKDLNNKIINYAYSRQCRHNKENTPYYFECLKQITEERGNLGEDVDALATTVAIAESMKQHTQTEIDQAYEFFDINNNTAASEIIAIYKGRINSAPSQAEIARNLLRVVGESRNDTTIQNLANQKELSVKEALAILQLQEHSNPAFDDFVASASVLIGDGDKDRVIKAIGFIAEDRDDQRLRQFAMDLNIGGATELNGGGALPVSEAYAALQAQPTMPDETILQYFAYLYDNNAASGSRESLLRALNAIAADRDSTILLKKAKNPQGPLNLEAGQPDEPVGLANIGNTCYLNSLLQYFYTVKPVRDIVLDFESYRMELLDDAIETKRVGGRKVKRSEIERAQAFVRRLSDLYTKLRVSSTRSVRPDQELAELTLYSESAEEQFRRAQEVSANSATTIDTKRIGDDLPPLPERSPPLPIAEDVDMADPPIASIEKDDVASDTTLVDDDELPPLIDVANDDHDVEMTDANETDSQTVNPAHIVLPGTTTDEQTKPFEAIVSVSEIKDQDMEIQQTSASIAPTINDSPVISKSSKLAMGAQQDVTEVIGNVMDYLRYAIKPDSHDPITGEQLDSITRAFYGSTATYTQEKRKIEPWCNLIVFPSENGPSTIYEALDTTFDEDLVELDGVNVSQYASIVDLPSILQIQIQRTMFDKVAKVQRKNQNFVEFDEMIYLDRYMDNPAIAQRKKENTKRRKRIQELNRQEASILAQHDSLGTSLDVLDGTKEFLSSLVDEGEGQSLNTIATTSALDQTTLQIRERLRIIDEERSALKAKVKEDFTDMRQHRYVLQSVFMHRGSSGGGHHFINIFDFKNNLWREYNDERVEEVRDSTKIYRQNTVRPGEVVNTAHFLVYVLEDKKDDLVDALFRDIPASEPPALPASDDNLCDATMAAVDDVSVEDAAAIAKAAIDGE